MSDYQVKFPELWEPGLVEGIDYEIRGVYRYIDEATGQAMVKVDRFYINNVVPINA